MDKEFGNKFFPISIQPSIIYRVYRLNKGNVRKADTKKIKMLDESFVTSKLLYIIDDFYKCDFDTSNITYFESNIYEYMFLLDFIVS